MRSFFTITLLFTFLSLNAQKLPIPTQIDRLMQQIPDSLTTSTVGIAKYINNNFLSQTDKSKAIFIWITNNIEYDIENIFAINFYQNSSEIVSEVLKSKKGVCMHFAELFNDIADKVGILSFVVPGYTRQNGSVDYIPHAWCVAQINSIWYHIDPTWGSGYIQNNRFYKQMNNFYYMTSPELLIKSHIPFDPMWELLNYPITNQEFYEGNTQINKNKSFFNYNDTIFKFINMTNIDKLVSSSRRIEKNGVKNSMVYDRLQYNKREIEYFINKAAVEKQNAAVNAYNEAVNLINQGTNQLNIFIEYRNHQFVPKRTDDEIRQMLTGPESLFNSAHEKIKDIKSTDVNLTTSIMQVNRSLDESDINLREQKVFLDKYFSSGKLFRKSLFYKYTWRGIPIGK